MRADLQQIIDKLKYAPPFEEKMRGVRRVYNLKGIREKAGLYFIKEDGVLVYIGKSHTNLQHTLYRHFQQWNWRYTGNARQPRALTYHGKPNEYQVAVVVFEKADFENYVQLAAIEQDLIYALGIPRDNKQKYVNVNTHVETFTPTEIESLIDTEPIITSNGNTSTDFPF